MDGTAVVTGGGSGIGRAVARQLVQHGLRVVVLARDAGRAGPAVAAIGAELVVGDLSDVASTRAAAAALAQACPRVDVLVQNAGIWPTRRTLNVDGVEQAFFTNHLAPFLLGHLLTDRLGPGSRVVQVAAGLYVLGRPEPERAATGADFHALRTYADSKLAQLAVLPLLAEQLRPAGVTVNAVHPGVIRTGLGARTGVTGLALRTVKRLWGTPESGARPVTRLAVDPAFEGVTGQYYDVQRATPVDGPAADPEFTARVWRHAAGLTGVDADVPGR